MKNLTFDFIKIVKYFGLNFLSVKIMVCCNTDKTFFSANGYVERYEKQSFEDYISACADTARGLFSECDSWLE